MRKIIATALISFVFILAVGEADKVIQKFNILDARVASLQQQVEVLKASQPTVKATDIGDLQYTLALLQTTDDKRYNLLDNTTKKLNDQVYATGVANVGQLQAASYLAKHGDPASARALTYSALAGLFGRDNYSCRRPSTAEVSSYLILDELKPFLTDSDPYTLVGTHNDPNDTWRELADIRVNAFVPGC